jgi:hypothetical protein
MDAGDYRFRFIADESFLEQLRAEAERDPEALRIVSERPEADATRLGFDLVTVATVITIISGTVSTIDLAARLFRWWQESKANKVIVQTQFRSFELHRAISVTEEDLHHFLQKIKKPLR